MKQKQTGFTVVELLIVIVVIAVLAIITVVAYNGIQLRARASQTSAALNQAKKKLALYQAENGSYPTSSNLADAGVRDGDVTFQYTSDATSYCLTATAGNVSYFIGNTTALTAGGCPGDFQNGYEAASCYAILTAGYSNGNGIYRIHPSGQNEMLAYCDMVTSGGGWTLIFSNPGPPSAWSTSNIRSLNSGSPSISQPYSILDKADSIKTNFSGKLRYRIDAVSFGRWGGVWEAPYTNTFVATSQQNNATNLEQYDAWTIDTALDSTTALTNVMPWIGNSSQLLSTWGGAGNWYGTLATASTTWGPAPYISPEKVAPGVIWYWAK